MPLADAARLHEARVPGAGSVAHRSVTSGTPAATELNRNSRPSTSRNRCTNAWTRASPSRWYEIQPRQRAVRSSVAWLDATKPIQRWGGRTSLRDTGCPWVACLARGASSLFGCPAIASTHRPGVTRGWDSGGRSRLPSEALIELVLGCQLGLKVEASRPGIRQVPRRRVAGRRDALRCGGFAGVARGRIGIAGRPGRGEGAIAGQHGACGKPASPLIERTPPLLRPDDGRNSLTSICRCAGRPGALLTLTRRGIRRRSPLARRARVDRTTQSLRPMAADSACCPRSSLRARLGGRHGRWVPGETPFCGAHGSNRASASRLATRPGSTLPPP